jgi:CubicO group peptidase (beta-lactamase class C family)
VPGPGYSELLAGCVSEEIILRLTNRNAAEYIYAEVLDPLQIHDVALEPDRGLDMLRRETVSVPFASLPARRVPLLSELLPGQVADLRPAFGALWPMRSAGRFLHAVSRQVKGHDSPGLPSKTLLKEALRPRRPPFVDRFTRREMWFAGGMMIDPRLNRLATRASPSAFGHNAGITAAVVLSDPLHDVTVALYLNGADADTSLAEADRMAIVDSVFDELGLAA